MLKVKDLNVAYSGIQVLWDLSFEIKEKEIVSIVGPNGAGKSTLINAITGFIPVMSGEIYYKGNNLRFVDPVKRINSGLVQLPEGRLLFPNMSVKENLKIGAYPYSARRKMDESFRFVYEFFPVLEERQYQVAGSLSGGEQQMLAIGMGLMACPELLILDEPLIGLAPIIIDKVMETLSKIRQTGITMILVEQNVYVSLGIADRGYVIENGRIVMGGKASDLLNDVHVKDAYLSL